MWPYPDEVDEGVVDVGAAGQEEAAAGAELVEEEELLLLRGWGRENVTAGDAGIRSPKPALRQGSPGRCGGGRGERLRPAPAARPPGPGCWGRRRQRRAAATGAPRGPPKTRPNSAGRDGSKGGGVRGTQTAGSPTSPVPSILLSLPSGHGGPRSAPCARGGGRGRAAAAGRTCEGGRRTNGRRRRTCHRPARSSPRTSPETPALTYRQWPWGTSPPPRSAAAGSCCAGGSKAGGGGGGDTSAVTPAWVTPAFGVQQLQAFGVQQLQPGCARGGDTRGSHLEELRQLLAGGLQALEAMLGTGKGHAGVLQRRQLAALHRPAGTGMH